MKCLKSHRMSVHTFRKQIEHVFENEKGILNELLKANKSQRDADVELTRRT